MAELKEFEELQKLLSELMGKAKTEEGRGELESMSEDSKTAVESAERCWISGVLGMVDHIGVGRSVWTRYEKPDFEDHYRLEGAIRDFQRGLTRILKEKCGCRTV